MSNKAVDVLLTKLESVQDRIKRQAADYERVAKTAEETRLYLDSLVQEEMDLSTALEELYALQQEGLLRS